MGRLASRAEMVKQGLDPAQHKAEDYVVVLMADIAEDGTCVCIECLEKSDPQTAARFHLFDRAMQIDSAIELAIKEGRLK